MLHIAHSVETGYGKIIVTTVVSDMVVLSGANVSALHQQHEYLQVWIAFGSGKHFKYIAAHEITTALGLHKSLLITANVPCTDRL